METNVLRLGSMTSSMSGSWLVPDEPNTFYNNEYIYISLI